MNIVSSVYNYLFYNSKTTADIDESKINNLNNSKRDGVIEESKINNLDNSKTTNIIEVSKINNSKTIDMIGESKTNNFENLPKYVIFWICTYLSENDLIRLSQYNDRYKRIVEDFPTWKQSYSHILMAKN
jgi:hypothetical protein